MSNVSRWKVFTVGAAIVLSSVVSLNLALGQGKAAKGKAAAAAAAADEAPAKAKGRLPAYYKDIVDAKQKDQIYAIQADYNTKIDALEAQIKKLTADRDAAVENVLSADQKDKLKKAREVAAAKKKKPDAGKPADEAKGGE
jgi:hypothetical protein